MIHPEYQSVEAFVQFLMDDGEETFSPGDAQKIARAMKASSHLDIIKELKSYGLQLRIAEKKQETRGFLSPKNGTFPFSGNNSTFSTPGGDSILGFVGRKG